MPDRKKLYFTLLLAGLQLLATAQDMAGTSTDDKGIMYSAGKIYVVVAVVVTIVVGIFIYLINLDKKIKQLEKQQQ